MATSHNTFEKRQRERDRAARAAEKRAKRLERGSGDDVADDDPEEQLGSREFGHLDEAGLIDALAALHQHFDDGDVDFETFEKRKAAITAQLAAR